MTIPCTPCDILDAQLTCTHHWVIATPSGHPHSPGTCRKCGLHKTFTNWLDDLDQHSRDRLQRFNPR